MSDFQRSVTAALLVMVFTSISHAEIDEAALSEIAQSHGFYEAALENCPHVKISKPEMRKEWSQIVKDHHLQVQFDKGKQLFLDSDDISRQCYNAVMMQDIFDPTSLATWLEDDQGKTKQAYDQEFEERLKKATNEIVAKRAIPEEYRDLIETEDFAFALGILNSALRVCGNVRLKDKYSAVFENTPSIYFQKQSKKLTGISAMSARNFQHSYQRDPLAACDYAKKEFRRYVK